MPIDWPRHARAVIERLGEDATFTHAAGVPVPGVKVIYVEPYRESPLGDGTIAGSMPIATGMSADLPLVAEDDELTVLGVLFKVKEPMPDLARGTVTLTLSR